MGFPRMGTAFARPRRNGNVQNNNFTVTGARQLGDDVSIPQLLDICLAENDRRLSIYDSRLLRPRLVPGLVRFARRFLRTSKRTA